MPENIVREEIRNWKLEIRELRVQGPRLAEGHVGMGPAGMKKSCPYSNIEHRASSIEHIKCIYQ
jgi:hypothetical protein